jgi:prepilin-type N-terminal cleavage/methylation domain-containing protein
MAYRGLSIIPLQSRILRRAVDGEGMKESMKKNMIKQRGFTIVELLIVIVVIGILAAITVVAYNGIQGRARDTHRTQDLKNIAKALELHKTAYGTYPSAVVTPNAGGWEVSHDGTNATNFLSALITTKTILKVPVDPQNSGTVVNSDSLDPSWSTTDKFYFYYRYVAGTAGCDATRGDFYILGATRYDTTPSGQTTQGSPGFSCSGRDWAAEGAWVTGGYTNG